MKRRKFTREGDMLTRYRSDGGLEIIRIGVAYSPYVSPRDPNPRVGVTATVLGLIDIAGSAEPAVQYRVKGGRARDDMRIIGAGRFFVNYVAEHVPPPARTIPAPPPAPSRGLLADSVAEALTEAVQRLTARITSLEGRIHVAENTLSVNGIKRV